MKKDNFYDNKMEKLGITEDDIRKAQSKRMKKVTFILCICMYLSMLLFFIGVSEYMMYEEKLRIGIGLLIACAIFSLIIYMFAKGMAKSVGPRVCLSNPSMLINMLKGESLKRNEADIDIVEVKFSSNEEVFFIDTMYKWIVNGYEWAIMRNYCLIPSVIITILSSIALSNYHMTSFTSFLFPIFMVSIIGLAIIVMMVYYLIFKNTKSAKIKLDNYVKAKISKLYRLGCLDDREYILLKNVAEMSIYGKIVRSESDKSINEFSSNKSSEDFSNIIKESGFAEEDVVKYYLYEKYKKNYNNKALAITIIGYLLLVAITQIKSSSIVAMGIGYSVANKSQQKGLMKAEMIVENKDIYKDEYEKALNELYNNELKVRNIIMALNVAKNR